MKVKAPRFSIEPWLQWTDEARRQFGRALDTIGLGPQETPHRVLVEFAGARVRAYANPESPVGPPVLIVPAPFKRAYIWDLMPEVSVVRHCLSRGFRVYLLDWLVPTKDEDGFGLSDYASHFPHLAIEAIESETGCSAPILAGHSLGGTFCAIFATLFPERVGGLILLDAPLAFGDVGGPLVNAAKAAPQARNIREMIDSSPIPGSVINALSLAAAPDVFQGQRLADLAESSLDPIARTIHARVERWTYDEFPLPGQLFEDVVEQLYRDDRFLAGSLRLEDRQANLARLRAPVMAVINHVGGVVPPGSVLKGLEAAQPSSIEVLEYEGDRGPVLQHLGPLVSLSAHERLWPKIFDWAHHVSRL